MFVCFLLTVKLLFYFSFYSKPCKKHIRGFVCVPNTYVKGISKVKKEVVSITLILKRGSLKYIHLSLWLRCPLSSYCLISQSCGQLQLSTHLDQNLLLYIGNWTDCSYQRVTSFFFSLSLITQMAAHQKHHLQCWMQMLSYVDDAPKNKDTTSDYLHFPIKQPSLCSLRKNTPYPGPHGLFEFYVTEKALWNVPVSYNEDNWFNYAMNLTILTIYIL